MTVATTSVARASPHDRGTGLSPEATLEAVLSPSLGGSFATARISTQHQIELIGSVTRLYLKSDRPQHVSFQRGGDGAVRRTMPRSATPAISLNSDEMNKMALP